MEKIDNMRIQKQTNAIRNYNSNYVATIYVTIKKNIKMHNWKYNFTSRDTSFQLNTQTISMS